MAKHGNKRFKDFRHQVAYQKRSARIQKENMGATQNSR